MAIFVLKMLIEKYNHNRRIEFLGQVSEKEKQELLRTCLFLVMPSRFEGWGITGVEANAAGKPVLGTRIKGLSEAVIDGKTALLIESENTQQLTQAMDHLIDNNGTRAELGREGRIRAKQYSWRSTSRRQYEFYETVIRN